MVWTLVFDFVFNFCFDGTCTFVVEVLTLYVVLTSSSFFSVGDDGVCEENNVWCLSFSILSFSLSLVSSLSRLSASAKSFDVRA